MELLGVLRALAEPSRHRIVHLLAAGPYCNQVIAAELGLTPAAVSQHLRVLREVGLVTGERRGYHVHYRLVRPAFERLRDSLDAELGSILAVAETRCCRQGGGEHCGGRREAERVQAPGEAPGKAGRVLGGADQGMPRR